METTVRQTKISATGNPDRFSRGWTKRVAGGAIIGGIIGAIVAVNFVIMVGPDSGYESSFADIFSESTADGVATIAILIAGPLLGAFIALRTRAKRLS